MNIHKRLIQAQEAGEVLRIIYRGGSKPGATRDVLPVEVTEDKVRARCYTSGSVKTFLINKVELVERTENEQSATWEESEHYQSAQDLLEVKRTELEALGWEIEYDETDICLYRRYKNGKRLKHPDVWLLYDECSHHLRIEEDGNCIEEVCPRARPWSVGVRRNKKKEQKNTSFTHYSHAAEAFLRLARKVAPASQ